MKFDSPLVHGYLIKRYKRFLADIRLDDDSVITAHCTNSGSMKSCIEENAEVYLSPVNDPKRKTRFTWEMIKINGKWVGINTSNPNKLAYQAVIENKIKKLAGYTTIKAETTFEDSRFDLYMENMYEKCFVEIKNVTYKEGDYALFPDAVTERGTKHLNGLIRAKKQGYRAAMLYIIQRTDVKVFAPAKDIDPEYAKALKKAYKAGVEIIPVFAKVTPEEIKLTKEIPFEI